MSSKFFYTLISMLFPLSVVLGQSNSEYSFYQYELTDFDNYASSPAVAISLDCIAANGYGQWLASSSPKTDGWFLWSNLISKPSIGYDPADPFNKPGCKPPGYVAKGSFIGPHSTKIKATANLDGRVRYVWPNDLNNGFLVQGFNDERGLVSGDQQISIDLQGLPNPSSTRQIVKQSIFNYPIIPTGGLLATEADYRDIFDICSDSVFLYIAWRATTGQIKVSATKLDDGSVVYANPIIVGNGFRPTVACNPRSKPTVPTFELAYLTAVPGSIAHASIVNATVTFSGAPAFFKDPLGNTLNYVAYHARILMSSVLDQPGGITGIYAIVQHVQGNPSDLHLVLHKPATLPAEYVDGPALFIYPAPIPPAPQNAPGWPVVDKHIVAFANPYDNQIGEYIQFHCLYQLGLPTGNNPLLIVRNHDSQPFNTPSDTRLCLNKNRFSGELLSDPDKYVGAINQMGIHVHWRTGNVHFYARDEGRAFDELIDENTLVTNHCKVKNGIAHGGTQGARLLAGAKMTLWTDPNYGGSVNPNEGLYQWEPGITVGYRGSIYTGTLDFDDPSISLEIGNLQNPMSFVPPIQATLANLPYTFFYFNSTNQSLIVRPNSLFDYYGLVAPGGNHYLAASPFTDGGNAESGAGTVRLEGSFGEVPGSYVRAKLKIHGGANFYISGDGKFISNKGQIECLYEPNLYPVQYINQTPNAPASGLFTCVGYTEFNDSYIIGHAPENTVKTIFLAKAGPAPLVNQFVSTNCKYENIPSEGTAELQFGEFTNGKYIKKCSFDGGTGTAVLIHLVDPLNEFSVQNMTFDQIRKRVVFAERTAGQVAADFGKINIYNNSFTTLASNGISDPNDPDQFWGTIMCRNFVRPDLLQNLIVENNTFNFLDNPERQNRSAILFLNATGMVLGNTIIDNSYIFGIEIFGEAINGVIPRTSPLLCLNQISGLSSTAAGTGIFHTNGIGIQSSFSDGYVKKNQISFCDKGYRSYQRDGSFIIFSKIVNSNYEGITVDENLNALHLSGVHGADVNGPDYAAYDTISNNSLAVTGSNAKGQINLHFQSQIDLANNFQTWSWQDFGKNNIIKNDNDDLLIKGIGGTASFGNIDFNYWGPNVNPGIGGGVSPGNWNSTNTSLVQSLNATYSANSTNALSTMTGLSVNCGSGTTQNIISPFSKPEEEALTEDECKLLRNYGSSLYNNGYWQRAYDSSTKFIEQCPNYDHSYLQFNILDGSVQKMSDDPLRYQRYQDWLKSVLYLNPSDPYFCACVFSIAGTTGNTNGALSVIKYLIDNPRCNSQGLRDLYASTRAGQRSDWLLNHENLDGLDTTLPSLEELGLAELLAKASVTGKIAPVRQMVSNFKISENPVQNAARIQFEILGPCSYTLQIFNLLGQSVSLLELNKPTQKGEKSYMLPILNRGIYFARLEASTGEVYTLKFKVQ